MQRSRGIDFHQPCTTQAPKGQTQPINVSVKVWRKPSFGGHKWYSVAYHATIFRKSWTFALKVMNTVNKLRKKLGTILNENKRCVLSTTAMRTKVCNWIHLSLFYKHSGISWRSVTWLNETAWVKEFFQSGNKCQLMATFCLRLPPAFWLSPQCSFHELLSNVIWWLCPRHFRSTRHCCHSVVFDWMK